VIRFRGWLRIAAYVALSAFGLLVIAITVTQTPWFKDWLRVYVSREAERYLDGQFQAASLTGNLFTGVSLQHVRLVQRGETVVAADSIGLSYNVFTIVSHGAIIDDLTIVHPVIRAHRDAAGWNLARLAKKQAAEADREGPGRPIQLRRIRIVGGRADIDDATATSGAAAVRLPHQVTAFDFDGSFSYQPVDFTLTISHLGFKTSGPDLWLKNLGGTLAIRGDDVHVTKLQVETAQSSLHVEGMVRNYLGAPDANLRITSPRVTVPEFAGVVPALGGILLRPAFEIAVSGPLSSVRSDLNVRTEGGSMQGRITADVMEPDRSIKADVSFAHINAAVLRAGQPASDVTGRVALDVTSPDNRTVRGTVNLHLQPSRAAGYAADAADVQAHLEGDRAKLTARASAYGATVTTDGTVALPLGERRTVSFDVRGRASHLGLHRLPASVPAPRLHTDITAAYHVVGDTSRLQARLQFDRSAVEGATIDRGTTVTMAQSTNDLSYEATGRITDLNPQHVGSAAGIRALNDVRLAGAVDAAFTVHGRGRSIDSIAADADVTVTRADFPDGRLSDVHLRANVDKKAVDATVTGRFDAVNPGRLAARPDLDTSLAGTLDAQVNLADMTAPAIETSAGRVKVELAPFALSGQQVRQVRLDATLTQGTAEVADLTVDSAAVTAHASGTVALTDAGASHLSYNVAAGDLSQLGALAGVRDVSGLAALEGVVTGNRTRLSTKGNVKLTNVKYGTSVEALSAHSDFDVAVPSLDVQQAEATAALDATLVKAAGQEIQSLSAKVRYANRSADFDTTVDQRDRHAEARGAVQLQPDAVNVRLDHLLVGSKGTTWAMPGGTPAEVVYTPAYVSVQNLQLANGDQRLSVAGGVNLQDVAALSGQPAAGTSVEPTKLTIAAEHVDLAKVDELTGGNRGLAGTLDATTTMSGALNNPIVDASLTIAKGAAQNFTYDRVTAKAHHDARGATVDARLEQSPGAWLSLTGTLPSLATWRDPDARRTAPISARLTTSTLNLGLVQTFTTAVKDVAGSAHADLTVAGTVGTPQLSGTLTIDGGAFLVNQTDTRLQGLQAAIRLHDDQVAIDTFHVLDENGHPLSASGSLTFAEQRVGGVDVRIDAQDFQIMKSRLGEVALDVDGNVAGSLPNIAIKGNVTVRRGRIEVDRVLEQMNGSTYATTASAPIATGNTASTAAPAATPASAPAAAPPAASAEQTTTAPPAAPSLFDAVSLDAHLRIPNNLILRGEDVRTTSGGLSIGNLNLTLGGDIQATKAAGDRPLIVGSIRTVRGFYEFKGRRFDLRRDGTVSFKGPDPTDPTLDVTGIRDIAGIEAQIHVHGTAKRPALDISSTPPLDEADVLSLIVFNRPVNELGEGERTSVAQTAATLAGGFVTAPLAEALRDALDVDLLEISAGGDAGAGPSVAIGNQFGEKVFIKVRQQFGSADVTEFLLDYQLTETLRLQTSAAEGAQTSHSVGRRVEPAALDFVFVKKY